MADYLPRKESELMDWARSFNAQIVATPTVFGLTAGQATAFTALWTTFRTAYETANAEPTRTKGAVQTKNTAKQAMIDGSGGIRELVNIIQAYPGTTNTMRVDLAITVPDVDPTPIPQPSTSPVIHVVSRYGRTVTLRLEDSENPTSRRRPAGVQGAIVYSWVGATPPVDFTTWKSEGNFTRTELEIEFPLTVAPSTQVWFTAQWYNPRGETGPATLPAVTTNLDSASLAEAA